MRKLKFTEICILIIIAIISIVVTISLAIFLFNQETDFIKVSTSDSLSTLLQ